MSRQVSPRKSDPPPTRRRCPASASCLAQDCSTAAVVADLRPRVTVELHAEVHIPISAQPRSPSPSKPQSDSLMQRTPNEQRGLSSSGHVERDGTVATAVNMFALHVKKMSHPSPLPRRSGSGPAAEGTSSGSISQESPGGVTRGGSSGNASVVGCSSGISHTAAGGVPERPCLQYAGIAREPSAPQLPAASSADVCAAEMTIVELDRHSELPMPRAASLRGPTDSHTVIELPSHRALGPVVQASGQPVSTIEDAAAVLDESNRQNVVKTAAAVVAETQFERLVDEQRRPPPAMSGRRQLDKAPLVGGNDAGSVISPWAATSSFPPLWHLTAQRVEEGQEPSHATAARASPSQQRMHHEPAIILLPSETLEVPYHPGEELSATADSQRPRRAIAVRSVKEPKQRPMKQPTPRWCVTSPRSGAALWDPRSPSLYVNHSLQLTDPHYVMLHPSDPCVSPTPQSGPPPQPTPMQRNASRKR